jgi:hypothetical protein
MSALAKLEAGGGVYCRSLCIHYFGYNFYDLQQCWMRICKVFSIAILRVMRGVPETGGTR